MSVGRAAVAGLLAGVLASSSALAADPSKQECVAANESAQDLQGSGKLLEARAQLAVCIATSCPTAVRQDCAQRLEEVTRTQPTLLFEAQDGVGNDLGAVRVVMDGRSLVERLDGSPVAINPGEHHFVFEAANLAPAEKTVIVRVGEKDRVVRVVLAPRGPAPAPAPAPAPTPAPAPAPALPPAAAPSPGLGAPAWASFAIGGAGLVAGGVLTVLWVQAKNDGDAACGVARSCDPSTANDWENKQRAYSIGLAVGFGVAAVGAGLGLLFAAGHAPSTTGALGRGLELRF